MEINNSNPINNFLKKILHNLYEHLSKMPQDEEFTLKSDVQAKNKKI